MTKLTDNLEFQQEIVDLVMKNIDNLNDVHPEADNMATAYSAINRFTVGFDALMLKYMTAKG